METLTLVFSILATLTSLIALIFVIVLFARSSKKKDGEQNQTGAMLDELNAKMQSDFNDKFANQSEHIKKQFDDVTLSLNKSIREGMLDQQKGFIGLSKLVVEELNKGLDRHSKEVDNSINKMIQLLDANNKAIIANQEKTFAAVESRLEKISKQINENLASIRQDNTVQLDKMREVVDEKLNKSLEERLTRSFSAITDKLEKVKEGFLEMQNLSKGVTDLTRVLNGVKTRGTWGETSLQSLIEDILAPEQYARNEVIKSGKIVEFCIKLPGNDKTVLLPVDSKFPLSDYQNLVDYSSAGDSEAVQTTRKNLFNRIKQEAKAINEYIHPPKTTDFAIMYLPIEGLYAEVSKEYELTEEIRKKYKILITGPSTFAALLNSLQVGFRTVALQKNSLEIQKVLVSFKAEFNKFADLLTKSEEQATKLSDTLQKVIRRTDTIDKKLKVIELPESSKDNGLIDPTTVGSDEY